MNETYPEWLLEGLGVTMWCNLTTNGTWAERYEADKEECWDIITSQDIVWFVGTRIIGTTPDDSTDIPILDDPSDGHGTAVTGSVLDAIQMQSYSSWKASVMLQSWPPPTNPW